MSAVAAAIDEFLPATQIELSRWMAENAQGIARPVYAAGGRTSADFGVPARPPGISLQTTSLNRVIDFPARDMTITVEAGIRIDELARVLATEGQRLPVDAPQAHRATLGGLAATNASASRRFGMGTMRDYVIGVTAVDPSGMMFKAGGRVVKNVAGYDLCKMLVGSQGTLAVMTQLTLKLRPIPESSVLLWATFERLGAIEAALERLVTSAARPVALDVLDVRAAEAIAAEAGLSLPARRPVLCLGVEGTARETAWQLDVLRKEIGPAGLVEAEVVGETDSAKLWFALAEFQVPSDDPLTFRANVLPSRTVEFLQEADRAGCALQAHAGNGIVVGHLPDSVATVGAAREQLARLRECARKGRGNLTIVNCDAAWKNQLPLMGNFEPAWRLMQKLKRELDPHNILNPHHAFSEN
jgi:glycolate oxidase FAD binding subunit